MKPLLTLVLQSYIDAVLGLNLETGFYRYESNSIPMEEAKNIFQLTKNQHSCHIEFKSLEGAPLQFPLLYTLQAWQNSAERFEKQKAYSHKQRIDKFIQEANVKIVMKTLDVHWGIEGITAEMTAHKLVTQKKWRQIAALGVKKLVTKEEEL